MFNKYFEIYIETSKAVYCKSVVTFWEGRKCETDISLNCWFDLIMNFLLLLRHDILIMKLTAAKK